MNQWQSLNWPKKYLGVLVQELNVTKKIYS